MSTTAFCGEDIDGISGITPNIEVSRTSGEVPLAIGATAAGTTATGSTNPADELEYRWDFGDRTRPHTGSPVGMGVADVNYHTPGWTFVDIMKMSKPWAAEGSGGITVDAEGHLLTIDASTKAVTYIFQGVGSDYPAGVYTCYYDGVGVLEWSNDATVATSVAGVETVTVVPSSGITLKIASTDAGDPIRNIRLIMPGFEINGKWRNNPFHPTFLNRLRHNSIVRFMDWAKVNNSTQTSWASRTTTTFATQDNTFGVALEYQIALANQLQVSPWFCFPHLATDDYLTQAATLIRDTLDPDLVAYIEFSNECWNPSFDQADWCYDQGLLEWPELDIDAQNRERARRRYYSDQSVRLYDIFETVFGGTTRIKRTMCEQRSTSEAWAEEVLDHNSNYLKVDAFALSCYVGGRLANENLEATVEAWTVTDLMDWFDAQVTTVLAAVETIHDAVRAAPYNIAEFLAYEGGPGITGYNDNSTIVALCDDATRDPRMKTAYTALLEGWTAIGCDTFVAYNNVMDWSNTGRWGHLETQNQARSASPKYDAHLSYAELFAPCFPLLYNPVTGNVDWMDKCQIGVNATYIYRAAGSYTITLTARSRSTGLVVSSATTTQAITTTRSWPEHFFDPVGGNDANDGLSDTTPKQTFTAMETVNESATNNLRLRLKRGTTLEVTQQFRFNASGRRLEPYGSGEMPIITGDGVYTGVLLTYYANNNVRSDWATMGIEFDCNDFNSMAVSSNTNTGSFQHGAVIDCVMRNSTGNLITVAGNNQSCWTFWNNDANHGSGASGDGQCYSLKVHSTTPGTPAKFLSVVGGSIYGGDGSGTLDHHIYPSGYRFYDLFSHIDFGQAVLKNFCINTNCQQDGAGIDNEFGLITDCDLMGASNGVDFGSGGSSDPSIGISKNYAIQRCAFHDGGANGQDGGIYGTNLGRLVIRDNKFFGQEDTYLQATCPGAHFQAYRNKFHHASAGTAARCVTLYSGQTSVLKQNTFEIVGGDDRAAILFSLADIGDHAFSENQYFAPDAIHSATVKPFKDGSNTFYSIAEWETLTGEVAIYEAPAWPAPFAGDFGSPVELVEEITLAAFVGTMPALSASMSFLILDPSSPPSPSGGNRITSYMPPLWVR